MSPLVKVLLRLARDQSDPINYLEGLLSSQWTVVSDSGGNLVNVSVNGKAYSFRVPDGMDSGQILSAIEQALEYAESGIWYPTSIGRGRLA